MIFIWRAVAWSKVMGRFHPNPTPSATVVHVVPLVDASTLNSLVPSTALGVELPLLVTDTVVVHPVRLTAV